MKLTTHSAPHLILTAISVHEGKMGRKEVLTIAKLLAPSPSAAHMGLKRLLDDGMVELTYTMTEAGKAALMEASR